MLVVCHAGALHTDGAEFRRGLDPAALGVVAVAPLPEVREQRAQGLGLLGADLPEHVGRERRVLRLLDQAARLVVDQLDSVHQALPGIME